MKFSNSNNENTQDREFVLAALQKFYRGDMQLVYDHLPEFLQSPALTALLGKLRDLEKEIHTVWEMEGYDHTLPEQARVEAEVAEEPPRKIVLPNAKVQQPYRFDLRADFPELTFEPMTSLAIEGFRSAGLALDEQQFILQGTPHEAGHYQLVIKLLNPSSETETFTADLHVIPDPRLLWKEVEPEPNQLFPSEHTQSQTVTGPDKYLYGASRRGRSHAHTGAFREDYFDLDLFPDDDSEGHWQFAAVADGAGSAKFSRRGAKEACQNAIQVLRRSDLKQLEEEVTRQMAACGNNVSNLDREKIAGAAARVLGRAAKGAWESILGESEEMGLDVSDFHTTLLLTAVRKFDFGWFVGAWWVGDGAIGLYRAGNSVEILGNPDGGQFAGQTRFLTSREVWEKGNSMHDRIAFAIVDDFTALALMTDGVSDPMFQTDHNLRQIEKWDEFWAQLTASVDLSHHVRWADEQLLEWLNFWSTGDHDDRTIVILH